MFKHLKQAYSQCTLLFFERQTHFVKSYIQPSNQEAAIHAVHWTGVGGLVC